MSIQQVPNRMYICVREGVPDHMVPVLVAHTVMNANDHFQNCDEEIRNRYLLWKKESFRKCVVRVSNSEWTKISKLPNVFLGYENTVMEREFSCAIPCPIHQSELPNVLKFAKLWRPSGG